MIEDIHIHQSVRIEKAAFMFGKDEKRKEKRMKRICVIAAVVFLFSGVILTVLDRRDNQVIVDEIKAYPVISVEDLNEYQQKSKKQEVVVKDITLQGNVYQEPDGYVEGEFFYLELDAYNYKRKDSDKTWVYDNVSSFVLGDDDLSTSVDSKQEISADSVYDMPFIGTYYPYGEKGGVRYDYYGLEEGDTLTAIMTVGEGSAVLHSLLKERKQEFYVYGDETALYDYMENFVLDKSYLFLLVGAVLAGFLLYAAYKLRN